MPGGIILLTLLTTVKVAAEPPANFFDLNTLFSGGVGTAIVVALYNIGKTMLNRALPSRSDARASTQLVLEGLNNMVKVLQEEKVADATRLSDKQKRIDELESAADKDYDRIRELRDEILDLTNRLAQKDRHINTLVRELRRLGAQVTGLELEDLEITHGEAVVRRIDHEIPQVAPESTSDTGPTPTR